ncbi:MAG: DUF4920 domain-containing protein [Microscillaceae bacterium]|nr:DUF4920 domain-containing protein [Microscillaceae bacterium]
MMTKSMVILLGCIYLIGNMALAQSGSHFGQTIDAEGAVEVANLPKVMKGKTEMSLKIQGNIVQTCRKKGCWMTMDLGKGETVMVRFKDYGFFVPKEGVDGKMAILQGLAKKEKLDVATLRHYAEDAGKSAEEIAAIKKPQTRYTFEAIGVLIPESR